MLVSVNEFYEGQHSVCRNPLLQKMFVFIGVGEKAGSGADVIVKGWEGHGITFYDDNFNGFHSPFILFH